MFNIQVVRKYFYNFRISLQWQLIRCFNQTCPIVLSCFQSYQSHYIIVFVQTVRAQGPAQDATVLHLQSVTPTVSQAK